MEPKTPVYISNRKKSKRHLNHYVTASCVDMRIRQPDSRDPRGTSQRCPCGARVPKKLSDREHVCTACGLIGKRDHVSAMEILRLGLSLQDVTKPDVRVCVS